MLNTTVKSHIIELDEANQIMLPDSICDTLDWNPGDRIILTIETNGDIRLSRLTTQIQNLQGIFKDLAPGISLADELIRDRRQEAQHNFT